MRSCLRILRNVIHHPDKNPPGDAVCSQHMAENKNCFNKSAQTKNLSFKTQTSESLEGKKKQHKSFYEGNVALLADNKRLSMKCDMNMSLSVNLPGLRTVCVKSVWEWALLDTSGSKSFMWRALTQNSLFALFLRSYAFTVLISHLLFEYRKVESLRWKAVFGGIIVPCSAVCLPFVSFLSSPVKEEQKTSQLVNRERDC